MAECDSESLSESSLPPTKKAKGFVTLVQSGFKSLRGWQSVQKENIEQS